MKRFGSFLFVSAAAVLFGMISWGGLLQARDTETPSTPPQTQQPSSQTQEPGTSTPPTTNPQTGQSGPEQTAPSQAQPPASAQQNDANGSKEYVGTIVKQGDKWVFQDSTTGTTYDIDHQDEVKKFEGKKVRVRGTLDSSGKIHVQ